MVDSLKKKSMANSILKDTTTCARMAKEAEEDSAIGLPRRRARALQCATQVVLDGNVADNLVRGDARLRKLEQEGGARCVAGAEAYA